LTERHICQQPRRLSESHAVRKHLQRIAVAAKALFEPIAALPVRLQQPDRRGGETKMDDALSFAQDGRIRRKGDARSVYASRPITPL